ncbi:MAG TPA: CRISPR-associated endoribonuclease Cas6 [Bacillota bacterium]|nr:CRISPR-associated endoribonuclease Cas6 [Bacillota bacterium]
MFGGVSVKIRKVDVKRLPVFGEKTKIYMLSPCTAYTTLENRQTRFYNPFDYEFSDYIRNNLLRKYESLYNKLPEDNNFSIRSIYRAVKKKKRG